jgi:hypothetical protein
MARAGTYNTFERRYGPIPLPDDSLLRDYRDPEILQAFDEKRFNYVWTVVEGDTGKLYLVPGFTTVNYLGRVLCERPWPEEEVGKPGYVY